tara:strand:+ start:3360 stop:3962 length:603 start_codon:yes stop_codon:yes gene_type:complete
MNNIKDVDLRDDFIGIFDTNINCQQFIDHFDKSQATVIRRKVMDDKSDRGARVFKVDDSMLTIESHMVSFNRPVRFLEEYNALTKTCMDIYVNKWSSVANFDLQQAYMNIQKTSPGQGYHVWHWEDGQHGTNRRMFATMLYLNDVEKGGETEFLHQSLRVTPQKGRFLIWPAHWTHAHRGNPPLETDKYIATSWIENQDI